MEALIARLSDNRGELRPNLQETSLNDVVSEVAERLGQNRCKSKTAVKTNLKKGDVHCPAQQDD